MALVTMLSGHDVWAAEVFLRQLDQGPAAYVEQLAEDASGVFLEQLSEAARPASPQVTRIVQPPIERTFIQTASAVPLRDTQGHNLEQNALVPLDHVPPLPLLSIGSTVAIGNKKDIYKLPNVGTGSIAL